MTDFEKAKAFRHCLAVRATEIRLFHSHWGDQFCVKNTLAPLPFSFIDPTQFTVAECEELNFGIWTKKSRMRLVPVWLFEFLKPGIKLVTLDCKSRTDKFDNDHRGGYLAYGVFPKRAK